MTAHDRAIKAGWRRRHDGVWFDANGVCMVSTWFLKGWQSWDARLNYITDLCPDGIMCPAKSEREALDTALREWGVP